VSVLERAYGVLRVTDVVQPAFPAVNFTVALPGGVVFGGGNPQLHR
jgi:hypothetical protein